MNEFKSYHPLVNFIYFVLVIGFSCVFMHPVCLGISLVCSFAYSAMLRGRQMLKNSLLYVLLLVFVTALINPLFNHGGVTILLYLPGGNPLTLESVIYGFCAGGMIASVICWFSCYNRVMTSDKFIYLFGRAMPSLSLILSMTLRFVPRFSDQLKAVTASQRTMGQDITSGNILRRAKHGLTILSAMTTWALENAIDTADSMKARGYGLSGRTSFSIYSFSRRDARVMLSILILGIYIAAGKLAGSMSFVYFPSFSYSDGSPYEISLFLAYLALCLYPVILELWEVRKWKAFKSKI